LCERIRVYLVSSTDAIAAREHARRGDPDGAIQVMRTAVNDLFQSGQLVARVVASGSLVETPLDGGDRR
jgi:adenylate cyclase